MWKTNAYCLWMGSLQAELQQNVLQQVLGSTHNLPIT